MNKHTPRKGPPNTVTPRKGQTVEIYFSRSDVGSGIRSFVVLGVGPRYITLYYVPQLHRFRIRRAEWLALMVVKEYIPHVPRLIHMIKTQAKLYTERSIRFNRDSAKQAIEVLTERQQAEDKLAVDFPVRA